MYYKIKDILDNCFFPAVPVTFNRYGQIDDEAQKIYARYMNNQPVSGVSLWAHTGRGLLLSKEQRESVFKTWRNNLSEDKLIICGVGSRLKENMSDNEFMESSLDMGYQAKRLGADALLVYPPVIYKGRPDQEKEIARYHKKLAELGLPIVLFYLYEEAGGISYSNKLLAELFAIDNVAGIKMATLDSVMTYQNVSNMILKDFPGIKLLTGEDRMYGYSFARGASGAIVGLGAVCQRLQKEMMNAFYTKDYDTFVKKMLEVDKLAECTFIEPMEGYIQKMLYILYLKGIIPETAAYDPFGPGITEQEKALIKKVMTELGEI